MAVEDRGNCRAWEDRRRKDAGSFGEQFAATWASLKPNTTSSEGDVLGFGVPAEMRKRAAPTWPLDDDRRRGRLLVGEVHDSYAAALGGVAGHSGLFGMHPAWGDSRGDAQKGGAATGPPKGEELFVRVLARGNVERPDREERRARKFARARVGHDASDVVVRRAALPRRIRSRRVYRDIALD